MSNTQKQIIKTTLLQIFDKIQIQNTEKVGYNSYITLLHQILFNEDNEEVCEEYVLFVLRQISHYIQSLHQQKGFKLLSLFFLASRKLSSPLHLKFMETILDLLKFHYSQLNFPFITKSFEEIVKYVNLKYDCKQDNPSLALLNNFLYSFCVNNENILLGMTCLKKLIENSNIICIENYYEDVINNVLIKRYKNPELNEHAKNEILNCLIRIILLKESDFSQNAKNIFDLISNDILNISLQKKVLNVIYLLILYCTKVIIPFKSTCIIRLKSLKSSRDKKVRENAVLILQIYNENVPDFSFHSNHHKNPSSTFKLKKSNSQEEIILNTKNDCLTISRCYNNFPSHSKKNPLTRSNSYSNFFYKKDKGVNYNLTMRDKNANISILTNRSTNSISLASTRSSSHSLFKLQKPANENKANTQNENKNINNNTSILCNSRDILNLSSISTCNCNKNVNKLSKENLEKIETLNTQMQTISNKFDAIFASLEKMRGNTKNKFNDVNTNINNLEYKIIRVSEEVNKLSYSSPFIDETVPPFEESNPIDIIQCISTMSIEDIKNSKTEIIEEIIIKCLGFLMKGVHINTIVSFVQLCLITIRPKIKESTISTIKDIFLYMINNKCNEFSEKEYVDITTILKLIS